MSSTHQPPVHHPSIGTVPPSHLLEPETDRLRYVRSPVYVLRAVLGALLLLAGLVVSVLFENALIGLFNDTTAMVESWPEWVQDLPVIALAVLTAILAAGMNVWLIATQHWRRLAVINGAALFAAVVSVLAAEVVIDLATSDVLAMVFDDDDPERELSLFLPALIAAVTVGGPWIRRSLRIWVVVGTGAYGLALAFFAVTPPLLMALDVGVGVFVGAAFGLIFKTPNLAPTRAELAYALTDAGLPVVALDRAAVDARGSAPWFAKTAEGDHLFVKVLGSEHRAADLLYRVYRWLRYRQAGDRKPFISLRRAVEHEAFTALQAGNRHISTPRFLAISDVGGDGIMLVYVRVDGHSLDGVAASDVSDGLLDQVWDLVTHLHEHGVAHRDLRVANLMLSSDQIPYVIDFGFAEMSANANHKAKDVAEMVASLAGIVGIDRSVASAIRSVPHTRLEMAIPWIQPQATSSATRVALGDKKEFEALRKSLREAIQVDETDAIKIERVSMKTVLILASLGLAAYVLIPLIADSGDLLPTLAKAHIGWVLVGLAASIATYAGATLGIVGALPCPLPVRPTFVAQLASSFTNRVTPAKVGGLATNVRYLQLQDVPTATAVSAIGLNTLAGVMIHVPATIALGLLAGREVAAFSLPRVTTIVWVTLVLVAVSAFVMAVPLGRRLVTQSLFPALKGAWSSVGEIAHRPWKLAQLFGGSFTVTAMYVVAMAASLQAFGADLDLVTLAFVYLAGSAVASAAPTPGGVGATEAALAAGYSAVGVPAEIAVAGVLLFRLLTFWLPILPGWIAFSWMQRTGRL